MLKTSRSVLLLVLLALAAAPVYAGSVTITWDPNTEPDIVGYKVFFGTQSGVYTSNTTLGNVTSWTVNSLTDGQTYYFAVQALNAEGLASPLSEEVSATLPSTGTTGGGDTGTGDGTSGGSTPCTTPATVSALTASPSLPAPAGTAITWTATASCGTAPLQYEFWLLNEWTNTWSILQEYAASNQVTWTPTTAGNYQLQVWVRSNGVTTTYEDWRSSGIVTVTSNGESTVPQITSFTADRTFPADVGAVTRFTAVAVAGSAPLEYRFWLYSETTNTWTILSDYGPTNEAVWTPTAPGRYGLQAWVRRAGSSATYEAWKALGWLTVGSGLTITAVTPNVGLPVTAGTPVTWTVTAGGGTGTPEYQFWLGNLSTQTWTVVQAYGASNQLRWTPTATGTYVLQVWARMHGSAAAYEKWKNSEIFTITGTPITVTGLAANRTFPVAAGTAVTLTASATGGDGTLQYQFYLFNVTTNTWTVLQAYSASNKATWTPTADGSYGIQVWVRSQGSGAAYEAWQATPLLKVSSAPAPVVSLAASTSFPAARGTAIQWTAAATGGTALQYQFWLNNVSTGTWTVLKAYSASNQVTWTPTAAGTYSLQVWVRDADSSASYDAWKGSGLVTIK